MFKNIFKNYKYLFLSIIIFLIFFIIELPYFIKCPGEIIDISTKINSNIKIETTGTLNMAAVTELRATIPTYLFSKIKKNWDLVKITETKINNETYEETNYRNIMQLNEANDIATLVAYKKAGKDISIKKINFYVTYIDNIAKTNLKIKDQIIKINDNKIQNIDDIRKIIADEEVGDVIEIKTNNGLKKAKIYEENGKKLIGLIITQNYEFENPIQFKFTDKESGSSGGLMMSLAIYNYLTNDSLTKERKIVGTGTIDINGNVGKIDGVKYKLISAVNYKADVFLVPYDNYAEAINIKNEYKYNIKIKPVNTIDEAIAYLKKE